MGERAAAAWVRFSQRRALPVLVVAALSAAAGGWGTARLYSDLRPDIAELLPRGAKSARDAARVTDRVGGWAELTVALHGPDDVRLREFADSLAPRITTAAPDLVAAVDYRIDDVQRFFYDRRWLFVGLADLELLRDRVRARDVAAVDAAVERIKAANPQPELFERFPDGYFLRRTENARGEPTWALVLRVRLAGNPNDYTRVEALSAAVRHEVTTLRGERGLEPIAVDYGGYVAAAKFEHDGLAEDLVVATLGVMLAVALVMALYYRSAKSIIAIGLPLLVGTLVTFGVAELTIGHVNSNTAFLGSIVVGNGINCGLILFARYVEERRRGVAPAPAMTAAVSDTWLATLTAALGASIAYGSLAITDFRGFRQFGLMGGVGMAACWLATYAFMPALVLAWERRATLVPPDARPERHLVMGAIARAVERAPRRVLAVTVLVAVASTVFLVRFVRDPLEYDFGRLRDSRALHGGGPAFWEDAVFGGHHDPCVILASDEREARAVAAAFEAQRRAHPDGTIGSVVSIASFVPEQQEAKVAVLAEIRALVPPELLALLPDDLRQRVEAVLPPADLRPFSASELPPMLRARLTERSGIIGTPVLVYPPNSVNVWNGHDALRVAAELRGVAVPDRDIPMASSLLVFADVLDAIARDGPRASLVSFLGVTLLVLVLFRAGGPNGWKDAGQVLLALGAGVLLFLGAAGALRLKLNMLSFIAVPITFGIGVDYATNIVQRRRVSGTGYGECLRTTGGAVALCSLTTVLGYSSLLLAHNQALRSFGILANLGELACLVAAFFVVPSLVGARKRAA